MPVPISRLRRWFAVAAIGAIVIVAGVYFYARHRVQNALKQVPQKIGLDVEKSFEGFTLAPSIGGRTIFKVQAKKAVQFKEGGRVELRDVTIILYGRDASRFDKISGSSFEYDPQSGDITSSGEVQIDLEANPIGLASPDQAPPPDLKNPIHLRTSALVFNRKTGDARTAQRVDFEIPQARGSAVGVSYSSKNNVLTLQSQIEVAFTEPNTAMVRASHGAISKEPREVVLANVHLERNMQRCDAEKAVLTLKEDNTLQKVVASGNVRMQMRGKDTGQLRADQMEVSFTDQRAMIGTAVFSGNVQMQNTGTNPMQGSAGRVMLTYAGRNVLQKIRAEDSVNLVQHPKSSSSPDKAQDMELTATAVDFDIAKGKLLSRAVTAGPAQIALRPVRVNSSQTVIRAGAFQAQFDASGNLISVHGAPDARVINSTPNQPDRTTTSNVLDIAFGKDKNIQSVMQQGNFIYSDEDRKATADRARYTPATQMIELSGSPRIMDRSMTTTANTIRLNRATGDGFAEGDVKSTYNDLKAQPNGALLASSSPIHVTARAMIAHRSPTNALYTGDVRLWQKGNVIQAPSMEFDRNQRSITALESTEGRVSTVLLQPNKKGQVTPVTMTASRLSYVDSQRKAHFGGGVTVQASDFVLTAAEMDVFLQAGNLADTANVSRALAGTAGKLERIVAQGNVVITQPTRKATGDQLTYTAAEDKFVLSGKSPSIFDAERGKITGVSLTLFRGDDRVLVEGTDTSPSVTQTQVAR